VILGWGTFHSAAAEVLYRWVDERGDPVHSDRPPPAGIDYEVISTGSSLVRPVDAAEGAVPLEVQPTPSNDFEPVDTELVVQKKNPEFCARARENLEVLNTHARIRVRNDQGELRYIDEEEKQERREKAQKAIDENC